MKLKIKYQVKNISNDKNKEQIIKIKQTIIKK